MKRNHRLALFFVLALSGAAACSPEVTAPPEEHDAYLPVSSAPEEVRAGLARARMAGASLAVLRIDAVRPEPGGHRAELSSEETVLLPEGLEVEATVLAGESVAEGARVRLRLPGPTTCGPLESEPETQVCVDYAFPTPALRPGERWQVAFREQHGVNEGFFNLMGGRSISSQAAPSAALHDLDGYVDQRP